MKSIFGLQEEYVNIANEMETYFLESGDDEIPEYLHDRLVINQNEMAEKISRYKDLIDEWQGNIETLDKKIETLKSRKSSIGKAIDRLKGFMSDALELYGQPVLKKGEATGSIRFAGLEFTVTKIRTKPVVIEDVASVPKELKQFSINMNGLNFEEAGDVWDAIQHSMPGHILEKVNINGLPDKREIKSQIELGHKIPGAKIDEQASYLKFS